MWAKLRNKASCKHKLVHHTTLHLRFGKTSLTINHPIFGHWVLSYTRWLLSAHHSQPKTWKVCTTELLKESIPRSQHCIQATFLQWYLVYWKWIQRSDHLANRFFTCLSSLRSTTRVWEPLDKKPLTWLARLKFLVTFHFWVIGCQRVNMKQMKKLVPSRLTLKDCRWSKKTNMTTNQE